MKMAVTTVINQSYQDWELWVIGDACTDDTEAVLSEFQDNRIQFYNRPENHGEQSLANNDGLNKSQGRYIAFLNHDDLWFPKHLEKLVKALENGEVDFIYSLGANQLPDSSYQLVGATPRGEYDPRIFVPASLWMFKRTLIDKIGYWKPSTDCYAAPSQDWLFRAWKMRTKMAVYPDISCILIQSGRRPNSYSHPSVIEHEQCLSDMKDLTFKQTILYQVSYQLSVDRNFNVLGSAYHLLVNAIKWLAMKMNVPPMALQPMMRYGKKGGLIRHLRKQRGLKP